MTPEGNPNGRIAGKSGRVRLTLARPAILHRKLKVYHVWKMCGVKQTVTLLELCVSPLHKGNAKLLCIVPKFDRMIPKGIDMAGVPEKTAATQSPRNPSPFVPGSTYHYSTCYHASGRAKMFNTPGQDRTGDLQRVRLTS